MDVSLTRALRVIPKCLPALLLLCFAGSAQAAPPDDATRYVYDGSGRLKAISGDDAGDSTGERLTAVFRWDAVGNLVGIDRRPDAGLSIIELTPGHGQPGSRVVVAGSGFESDAAANQVRFNGTPATVLSATKNELEVQIPAGASTGAVTVTTPAGMATSDEPFTVRDAPGPKIDALTPNVVKSGDLVTISGRNFAPRRPGNTVRIQGMRAVVESAADGELQSRVPAANAGGRVDVTTSDGTTRGPDLFVAPSGLSLSDVFGAGRIATGESHMVSVTQAGKIALVLIDGRAGQVLSVKADDSTISSGYLQLYRNDGAFMVSEAFYTGSDLLDAVTLPSDGTYTLVVDPTGSSTGSVRLTAHDVPALAAEELAPTRAGAAKTLTFTTPGQKQRVRIPDRRAGQTVALRFSTSIPSTALTYRRVDGSQWISTSFSSGDSFRDAVQLPTDGTYDIEIDPSNWHTGSVTVTAYDSSDSTATVTPSAAGDPVDVALPTPGQNARYTFSGRAGDVVSASVTQGTIASGTIAIYKPDGAYLAQNSFSGNAGFLEAATLPVDGTYTIVVDPTGANTGSGRLTVYDVPETMIETATPTPAGVSKTFTFSTPGQRARLRLPDRLAGQSVSLRLNSTIPSTSIGYRRTDGTLWMSSSFGSGQSFRDAVQLPADGTYDIELDPTAANVGTVTVTAYDSTDVTAAVTPTAAGEVVDLALPAPGQNARFTIAGRAGQSISAKLDQSTVASGLVAIYKPTGGQLSARNFYTGSGYLEATTLPSDGTYTLVVDPAASNTGSLRLTVYDVPQLPAQELVPTREGASTTVAFTTPGQKQVLRLPGRQAGQSVSFRFSSNIPSTNLTYKRADGTQWIGTSVSNGDSFRDAVQLPADGTYEIELAPASTATGTMTVTAYDSSDVTGTITPTAAGESVDAVLSVPGQNARYTFSGTSGRQLIAQISESTIGSTRLVVYRPDGTTLGSRTFYGGSAGTPLSLTLPTSGTYTVLLDPASSDTGSLRMTLALNATTASQPFAPDGDAEVHLAVWRPTLVGTAPQPSTLQSYLRPKAMGRSVERRQPAGPPSLSSYVRSRPTLPLPRDGHIGPEELEHDDLRLPARRSVDPAAWRPTRRDRAIGWTTGRERSDWEDVRERRAAAGITAVSGRALTLNGLPLAGVTIELEGSERTARTDRTGRFLLTGVPHGKQVVVVDGRTARSRRHEYGIYEFPVELERNTTTALPETIWMTALDPAGTKRIPAHSRKPIVITNPQIPGFEVRLPAGSRVRDAEGRPVRELNLSPVPVDRPPFALPEGVTVSAYFTVQPGRAYLSKGAQIVYPNYHELPPGQRVDFWNFDADDRGWYVYGKGTVTKDGKQIMPDKDVRVWELTGAMADTSNSGAPESGPDPGGSAEGGDPVDLATGLFVYKKTDLVATDVIPAVAQRIYRPLDNNAYTFGRGTASPYDLRIENQNRPELIRLVMPDGGVVPFDRKPEPDEAEAIYEARRTAAGWFGATFHLPQTGSSRLERRDGTTYTFDGRVGPVSRIRDRAGNELSITRDRGAFGLPVQVTTQHGRWLRFTYDASNRATSVRDSAGRVATYTYTADSRLRTATNVDGGTTTFEYDSQGRMTSITDARGITFLRNQYDPWGKVDKQVLANGGEYHFDYWADRADSRVADKTIVTNPRGIKDEVDFFGQVPSRIVRAAGTPSEQVTTIERNPETYQVTRITGPGGKDTTFDYDGLGNITAVTELAGSPGERTTTFSYLTDSKLRTIRDPLGNTTTYGWDDRGRLTSITDPTNRQSRLQYDGAGSQPSAMVDAGGHETRFTYEEGDLVAVRDPLGNVVHRTVDAAGRVTSVTDPLGRATRVDYTDGGLVERIVGGRADETSLGYDANGNLTRVTDARQNSLTATYDSSDLLQSWTDALGRTHRLERDVNGNVTRVSDRKGQVTTMRYDELDRRVFAGFGTTGGSFGETYESTLELEWDDADRLVQLDDSATGTIRSSWDAVDRLVSQTTPNGTVGYAYDLAGRRTEMTTSTGVSAAYAYDAAGRLTSIVQNGSSVTLAHDGAGRLSSAQLPNAVTRQVEYDAAGRATAVRFERSGSLLGDLRYAYDAAGQRTAMWGSLAAVRIPDPLQSAGYDAANRRIQQDGSALTWDANGNLTDDGQASYAWNARDQLTSIEDGAATASFEYDGFGRRARIAVDATERRLLYDGWNVVQELAAGPSATRLNGLGLDQQFARTGAAPSSVLTDALGGAVATTDGAGDVVDTFAYGPFGESDIESDHPYQYTGRENDGTGLLHYRHRYYSPELKRFISEDPLGLNGGDINLYVYARNNPVSYTDPLGLEIVPPMLPPISPPTPGDVIDAVVNAVVPDSGTNSVGVGAGLGLGGSASLNVDSNGNAYVSVGYGPSIGGRVTVTHSQGTPTNGGLGITGTGCVGICIGYENPVPSPWNPDPGDGNWLTGLGLGASLELGTALGPLFKLPTRKDEDD